MSRGLRVARDEITLEIDLMCQMPTCFVETPTTHGHDCKSHSTLIPRAPEATVMVTVDDPVNRKLGQVRAVSSAAAQCRR